MNEDRIKELFANEEFVNDLFESKSYEEAHKKLVDKDVDVSIDELKKALELIKKKQAGELSDEELEDVAGGVELITAIAVLVTAGVIGGVSGGFIANACKKSGC